MKRVIKANVAKSGVVFTYTIIGEASRGVRRGLGGANYLVIRLRIRVFPSTYVEGLLFSLP